MACYETAVVNRKRMEHPSFLRPRRHRKTVLLKQFEQMHEHLPIVYIDGHQGIQTAEDFRLSVSKQLIQKGLLAEFDDETDVIVSLKTIAQQYDVLVLLLDGLDQMREIKIWLKDDFLKNLPANVRVFTAGRLPLTDWQHEFGWETMVHNMQMKPFSKNEWTQYANACGITDDRLLYQIGILSQGIPLAVALTCSRILQHGNRRLLNETDYRHLLETFDRYLLSDDQLSGINMTLLSLASLTYTFDQEMLEYMLDQPINSDEFTQLCQSSFVQVHAGGGWMVKHGIRRWARARLKERFPDTYERYKKRAAEIVERRKPDRLQDEKVWKLELAIRKFLLLENEYVENVIYRVDGEPLTSRAAREEEIPILAEMYQKNIQILPPFLTDDSHQEQYLNTIYQLEPSAIQVFEYGEQLMGFYVLVSMNENMIDIFRENPMTQAWIRESNFDDHDRFFWILSTYASLDWEIIDYFLNHVFIPLLNEKRITCLIWYQGQGEFLRLLGFDHLDFADFYTPSGLKYSFYQLDPHQPAAVSAKTDSSSAASEDQRKIELSDWMDLTKKLLSTYGQLQLQQPLLNQCNQLWGTDLETEEIVERIQKIITRQLQWLKEGSKQEKIQAQILEYAYLKRRRSHETVADLLNLPTSTYYRQLKKLIHGIAYILQSQT